MELTSVDVWTVVVPVMPERVNSPEWQAEIVFDKTPVCLIRLNTNTELYGIGECQRGHTIEDVRAGAVLLLGRDPEKLALQSIFQNRNGGTEETLDFGRGPAYRGFETALFDLLGRAWGVPVHAILGGAVRDHVRADYWMGRQTPEDSKRAVEWALEHGFKGAKIKCKLEDPMVERLQAILEVGGPDFKVTVDPNQRFYTAAQTIELAHQLEPLGNVEVFEDPITKADLTDWADIHAAIHIPLALHCNWPAPLENRARVMGAITSGVVDCVNLSGGLLEFGRVASVAAAGGLNCWHGSGNDLGIADTSYVHAAAAAPSCTMASDFVGSWTREDDLLVEAIPFVDGQVPTPQKPGLGCELDLAALERYGQAHQTISLH